MKTIDIEPKWVDLCHLVSSSALPAEELIPACQLADTVRQAQKAGRKSITFDLSGREISVKDEE